jgi:alpha-mannosidase
MSLVRTFLHAIDLKRNRVVLVLLSFCLAQAIAANAQTPEQLAEATKSLSPQSQTIMNRLAELSSLPAPSWRVHVGDLPHGEDPAIDDSAWPIATLNYETPAEQAAR